MIKNELKKDECPLNRAVEALGDTWSLLILREIMLGSNRFSDLHEKLFIAKNILSQRLKHLVARKIISAKVDKKDARVIHYSLTKKGQELFVVFLALRQWAEKWTMRPDDIKFKIVERKGLKPLPDIQIKNIAGEKMTINDVVMIGH
jgi:DNA-binding HxlR family transcriptional regulator